MARKVTPYVIGKLKQWEGCRLNAYRDSAGVWTIGYGHTGPDVKPGMQITQAQADKLLMDDLARFERAVDQGVKVPLTDNQFGTLVSFAFNIGVAAFEKSTLLRKLNAGDYNSVPSELARWVNAGGRRLQGLVNRRAAEAGLWVTGAFVSSAPVVAAPLKSPLVTGENLAAVGSVLSSVAVASSSSGPLQWALAAALVAAVGAGLYFLARRHMEERA
ncbi:lysozyme [Pseudochelatococcus sp. G4_1912]|uniref:lysozyme n=1 Tax=Pseudochelatococcus sp. G4_1912 TaxID=3114288 RepID=UPI0039C698B8